MAETAEFCQKIVLSFFPLKDRGPFKVTSDKCQGFGFYEVKKWIIIMYKKKLRIKMEKESTCTLLIISIVKKLQKEQNSKNLTIVAHSSRMTSLYPFCQRLLFIARAVDSINNSRNRLSQLSSNQDLWKT